jgi:uncharacterized membrane protein (DUF106 family)
MDFIAIIQAYPKVTIIVLASLISLISLIITKYVTDQKKMKELKIRQKELSKLSKEFKHDIKKLGEINAEVMQISMEMMKHSFKPLIFTMIPLLLLFWWVGNTFEAILPSWIWYYIIAGIVSSIIFRKLLDVA